MNPQIFVQEPVGALDHLDEKNFFPNFGDFKHHHVSNEPFTERQQIMERLAAFRNLVKENIPNALCSYTLQLLHLALNTQNIMNNYYWVDVDWPTVLEFPRKHHFKMCATCRFIYLGDLPLIFN